MADKNKTANTDEVKKDTEEIVTISKSEYEALRTDIELMKKQFVSEQRQKTVSDKQREKEEAMVAQTIAANEKAEELVDIHVELGSLRSNKNVEVSINGVQYIVPRGQTVKVPRKVAEVVENSIKQRAISLGMQEEKHADSEKAITSGMLTV